MVAKRERGELEHAVLQAVADLSGDDQPVAVSDVQARLSGDPAYTTVMTTMARLVDKGALTRVRSGRAFRYGLAASPDTVASAVTARRMRRLLSDHSDRAGVLTRFVAELAPDEERLLLQLLDRTEP